MTGPPEPDRGPGPVPAGDGLARYSRHLLLPEVGPEGQRALGRASVLVVGAGGLGSPAALYLAAAGVGTIGIVDDDQVDLTNLQRQILHATADIGRSKAESARETIAALNPGVDVRTFRLRLDASTAPGIIPGFDVVVDGSDNFPTRYLVNDACVLHGKPNVHGSVLRFEGQATVFDPKRGGPCYRCLYPAPPPPGLVPGCAEAGVLGALPGVIGSIQALAAIKLIVGLPEPLVGKLLLFDALGMKFHELSLKRDPGCPICGDRPTIDALIDDDDFCGMKRGVAEAGRETETISVEELKRRLDRGDRPVLLDVREPFEHAASNIGGRLIPRGELANRLAELDPSDEIVVYCRTGNRSAQAAELLRRKGFTRVRNLDGGIVAWAERIDPSLPRS